MRSQVLTFLFLFSVALSAQIVPNKGQWEEHVLFRSEIPGGMLFFEENKLTYNLMHPNDYDKIHGHAHRFDSTQKAMRFHSFQMNFLNADPAAVKSGVQPTDEKLNYFQGKDPAKWKSDISAFKKVKYSGLYKGIDLLFYKEAEQPKYDFIVHAGADVNNIQLRFDGAEKVFVSNNELKIRLSFTDIIEQIPIAYQLIDGRKVSVPCFFVVKGNVVSFKLGESYDKNYDLVIDPLLIFSTYSGSTGLNFGYTATYDDEGFLYAGGSVFETGYPTTVGAYDVTFNSLPTSETWGVSDIAITKYDTSGTKRIYSTYIGGSNCEVPHSLIVNSKGELIIYGSTGSDDYPVTAGAIDQSFGGGFNYNLANGIFINYTQGSDIVISKLSVDGGSLLGSTYFGGSSNDGLNLFLDYNYADQMRGDVILDSMDNIYIASCTYSNDIVGVNGFQTAHKGVSEGLVAKMNANLTSLVWASYLGGTKNDAVYSILLDGNENLVVAGGTTSNDLVTTPGVLFPTFQGNPSDGFIAKISNDGKTLNTLTYFGTATYDQVYFVKMDKLQNIYVYGQSASMDSALVKNAAYYSIKSGQFVSKLNNDLTSFIWSTTFGSGDGKINISPTALMVDLCTKVYLTGWGSPDGGFSGIPNYLVGGFGYNGARGTAGMPVTPDAFQSTTEGSDFYIFVLEDDASAISYASFFGGNLSHEHVDGGTSRFDRKGKIYQSMCAGCGGNSDMPIFPSNAVSPTNNSNCNNGVFKMDFLLPNLVADFKVDSACASQAFQFKNTSLGQKKTTYHWHFGDGDTSSLFNPNHVYTSPGTYQVKLVLNDPDACNLADSIVKPVHVKAYKTQDLGVDTICEGATKQIGFTSLPNYNSYWWQPGQTLSDSTVSNPLASPDTTTSYIMLANTGVCRDTFFYELHVVPSNGFLSATTDADTIVKGTSTTLHVAPANLPVIWSPSVTLDNDTLFDPQASPLSTTTYAVNLKSALANGCASNDSVTVYVYDSKCGKNDIYIPNVFTPNDDGKNDLLFVRGNNITELYFVIYDRWGEKVFETSTQSKGWNGEYKTQSSDPAVFVYYLKVKCAGEDEYFEKGNITVMR
ncbi:MAG: gliding motility-associated C-terminal domain-containing protein [Flavobacteriales bacterium]